MLVVYKMAYYRNAGLSRCVPMNADFLRDTVKEMISDDVNQTEEYGIVSIVLIASEFVVVLVFGVAYCLRKDSSVATPRTDGHQRCDGLHIHDPRDAFQAKLE